MFIHYFIFFKALQFLMIEYQIKGFCTSFFCSMGTDFYLRFLIKVFKKIKAKEQLFSF